MSRTNLVRRIGRQEAEVRIGRRHVGITAESLWTAEHSFNYIEQLAGEAPIMPGVPAERQWREDPTDY